MNATLFFSLYLPALEEAFAHEEVNSSDRALGPDWFIAKEWMRAVDDFEENDRDNRRFLDDVAHYFHALEHSFPSWDGVEISEFKRQLIAEKDRLKAIYLPQKDKQDE